MTCAVTLCLCGCVGVGVVANAYNTIHVRRPLLMPQTLRAIADGADVRGFYYWWVGCLCIHLSRSNCICLCLSLCDAR